MRRSWSLDAVPANCEVEVTLGAQQVNSQVDANGGWRVEFAPLPAGGPVTMTASDGSDNSVILERHPDRRRLGVFGHLNMQMGLQEADGGAEAIAAATSDMPIRVLSVPKATAKTPQSEIGAEWNTALRSRSPSCPPSLGFLLIICDRLPNSKLYRWA